MFQAGPRASADTPSPTPLVTPSQPTPLVSPTIEPTISELPTVVPERSTPILTSEAQPTLGVEQTATLPPSHESSPQPLPSPTRSPVAVQAPTVPDSVPLPSPEQLRLDARLRWGTRVPATVRRWAFLIVPAARKYGLDPNLIAAVMTMESGGDPLAWNGASDARGLMQILHGPWDPKKNVYTGARMFSRFLAEFNDLTLALAAYNAGPNAVLAYGGVPPYRETRDYVIVVSYLYDLFSHKKLTAHRRAQYRSTLKDLARFADQRTKIRRLALVGHVSAELDLPCRHHAEACDQSAATSIFSTLDPFWPLGGSPDPLQLVDPYRSRK